MPAALHFGFLWFDVRTSPSLYVGGALLVTDALGNPQELRVATPVKPNRVQRAIWGDRLIGHAICNLLGNPLLSTVELSPTAVFANRIEALEVTSPCPLAFVEPGRAAANPDVPHVVLRFDGNPAVLSVKRDGLASVDTTAETAARMHELLDPFEVFARIEAAMAALAESDSRYG